MEIDTYYHLENLRKSLGDTLLGQVCQNLLALSFFSVLSPKSGEVNNVEGIDILIEEEERSWAVEVKTTSQKRIVLGKKDIRTLEEYERRGYITLLAILPLQVSKEWILYPFSRVKGTSLEISLLGTKRELKSLQKALEKHFEDLVRKYAYSIQKEGVGFTIDLLKKHHFKWSGK